MIKLIIFILNLINNFNLNNYLKIIQNYQIIRIIINFIKFFIIKKIYVF